LAIFYVDNTDLLHIDLTKDESMDKVHGAIQSSINSRGNLLIATGVLQLSKCFYSIIWFKWENGHWKYANNSLMGEIGITVHLPGGKVARIEHKSVNHAEKTLGTKKSPD
jgi:hypothetical protein